MIIETKYEIGQFVFLITDKDKLKRIITNVTVSYNNSYRYCLQHGAVESWNYEFEIDTIEENVTKTAGFTQNGKQ